MIEAEAHSDDYAVEVTFDATTWFEQASDEEIVGLAKISWGGDYESDAVARFYEDTHCERLFTYLSFDPTMSYTGDTVGFECHISNVGAADWIEANRPHLVEQIEQYI